jgi:hypothetical protein
MMKKKAGVTSFHNKGFLKDEKHEAPEVANHPISESVS